MTYKYLGVIIDNQLDPDTTLKEATKRIGVYVYRNRWLIKKHFSIRSLLQICEYFQQSRITYGMSIFLPSIRITKKVESTQ